ncbi:MAG: pyridoxal 5'-phosphate synthase glutaminase subunit PdxT [Selenomonadales bacterium]|jgi:pyridoxal 5'-phosphate synthase, glutaminase subunit pdx2|nr:pyridoxal 5'-phosphate synthase glutaminase subunit PdxT [Clostridiales bacterium]PWL99177.1 MAG: pyridoxal 5'-phosphate synthase glutaminase subunit PdxT [Selenomonadales bacterium]
MRIGVLALQGAFIEHEQTLARLGVDSFELRRREDAYEDFDGLIIPGGESSVQGKLLRELNLFEPLRKKLLEGMPVLGTCAGLLLLAKEIKNDERRHLATMDIQAKRNAYGRQLGSFKTSAHFKGIGEIPMSFIRAPYISEVYKDAEALAWVNGKIVAARQQNQIVTAFHPELTGDLRVHSYFCSMAAKRQDALKSVRTDLTKS